jgi:hypothetical protein
MSNHKTVLHLIKFEGLMTLEKLGLLTKEEISKIDECYIVGSVSVDDGQAFGEFILALRARDLAKISKFQTFGKHVLYALIFSERSNPQQYTLIAIEGLELEEKIVSRVIIPGDLKIISLPSPPRYISIDTKVGFFEGLKAFLDNKNK